MARLVPRRRERDDDPRAAAFTRLDARLAAELQGKPADQRKTEAAAAAAAERGNRRIEPIVLDHQLDLVGALFPSLDADLGDGDAAEVVVEGATHRLGDDQADGNRDVRP